MKKQKKPAPVLRPLEMRGQTETEIKNRLKIRGKSDNFMQRDESKSRPLTKLESKAGIEERAERIERESKTEAKGVEGVREYSKKDVRLRLAGEEKRSYVKKEFGGKEKGHFQNQEEVNLRMAIRKEEGEK